MSDKEPFIPSLKILAAIDTNLADFWREEASDQLAKHEQPRGARVFRRVEVTARFHRNGLTGELKIPDVERAREVLANLDATSLPEIKDAIRPLAGLPVDYKCEDDKVLYLLGKVSIRSADIRLAQRLIAPEAA